MTITEKITDTESVRAWVDSMTKTFEALPEGTLVSAGRDVAGLIEPVTVAQRRLAELQGRLAVLADEQAEAAKVAASGTDA